MLDRATAKAVCIFRGYLKSRANVSSSILPNCIRKSFPSSSVLCRHDTSWKFLTEASFTLPWKSSVKPNKRYREGKEGGMRIKDANTEHKQMDWTHRL